MQAIANGNKTYVPEAPCLQGHSFRSIHGSCIECRKVREKIKYYADPEKTRIKVKAKYQSNAEKIRAKRRITYALNAEKEKSVAVLRSREWRDLNPNHLGAKTAKLLWKKLNKGKNNFYTAKRRAAKLLRTPAWLSNIDLERIKNEYRVADLLSKLTGRSWHVDHIIPLQGTNVSGLHVPNNLRAIPEYQNVSKSNKHLLA